MTQDEFDNLQPGDIIYHPTARNVTYVVTGNYGSRVTAVRTVDMSHPPEWCLASKVTGRAEPAQLPDAGKSVGYISKSKEL